MGLFDKFKRKSEKTFTVSETDTMYLYTEKELDEYECFIQENF